MNTFKKRYDVIVVGAGHAGCEAALAAARMGARIDVVVGDGRTIALEGPFDAALVSVYLHGLTADYVEQEWGTGYGIRARDLVETTGDTTAAGVRASASRPQPGQCCAPARAESTRR